MRTSPEAFSKSENTIYALVLTAALNLFFVWQTEPASAKPFQPADYPESKAKTYTLTLPNSQVAVEALQVKRLNEKHSNPRYCRAWVTISKNGKKIGSEYFEDINGLGGACGLYFPNKPISANYLGIVKLGDYDGRLLLVNKDGRFWNIPGGSFFTSKDKKLLFSTHECDASAGIAVFDLQKGTTVFQSNEKGKDIPPVVRKWYFDGENYFFTTLEPEKATTKKSTLEVYVFDTKESKLLKKTLSQAKLAAATQIVYDFNAMSESDLKAAEQGSELKSHLKDAAGKGR